MLEENNKLELRNINSLLKENFYIPAYQRGYRWTKKEVVDLLNDIWEFSKSKPNDGEFYCLQPIVVKQYSNNMWELIDGQQRITTLYILLSFLKIKISNLVERMNPIEFETRIESTDFLENKLAEINTKNIDFFHMSWAYKYIEDWFDSRNNIVLSKFAETLLYEEIDEDTNIDNANNIRVIWYESEKDIDSISIFTRINMGKIPLTNAELVKALLLSSDNIIKYKTDSIEQNNYKTLKQLQIATQWDMIENKLQDDKFWYFINNSKKILATRIEFIFDFIADEFNETEKLEIDKKNNEYFTFMVFNKYFNKFKNKEEAVDKIWKEVKKYFMSFEEWYEEDEIYHLIGYLVYIGKNINEIKKSIINKSKKELKIELVKAIGDDLNNIDIDILRYDKSSDKDIITKVLLLFNIETIIQNKSSMRFQFDKMKNDEWSLEHIHAQKSKGLEKTVEQKKWLEDTKKSLLNLNLGLNLESEKHIIINEIESLVTKDKISTQFIELQDKIFSLTGDDTDKDLINNLALLSKRDNSSLGNKIFSMKRDEIVKWDKNGYFIPICTKNVFLKYYSIDISQVSIWSDTDKDYYIQSIKETLNQYLPTLEDN